MSALIRKAVHMASRHDIRQAAIVRADAALDEADIAPCAACGEPDCDFDCDGPIEDADQPSRVDCGNCYGNGCSSCGFKGTVETQAGRDRREEHEDGAYDRWKDDHLDRD